MSASKHINIICVIITILAVVGTIFFMNGQKLGIAADDSVELEYVDTLFDDSYVHTINIEIDNWDELIENAESEEYTNANVTIDGETVKNVGIRAKGNTSLSTVSQLGSERYSFKIEFDSYEDTGNYKGLDKLCLNNLIQDYTMMKDYIAYKLMNEFGADAPLASFCYITVNGEDWGLYLAVEAVEDSFLQRNYGKNYGELYKPDSMSMGGGRGNGRDFDMEDFDFEAFGEKNPFESSSDDETNTDSEQKTEPEQKSEKESTDDGRPKMPGGDFPSGDFGGSGGFPGGGDFPGGGGPFGMGNSDVKLQYSDDDVDSYSTIFNNAKTVVKTSDKKRLIKSLKNLSEGIENSDSELIEQAVNTDEVMRYMVVHNFVVNGDSYTGSMIHNYYLYEEDGQMSMIPWDYNLAYGTFMGQDATGQVNDPIDTPLSITENSTDRPMFSWITSSDEYTKQYHEYYEEFLNQFYTSGYLQNLIDDTYEMLYEYVEKDPTKFCTIEEYEQAVKTLKGFVELRCQSIEGQVNGEIPTTDSLQQANSDSLIDASSLTLSDMGSMGGGFGGPGGDSKGPGGFGGPGGPEFTDKDKKNGMGEKHRENK
ncbi:MAG: CotH kinase family protein [Lachnospiraceae bacterium]|nr:CotH kinase family protein [Lachnospiraceae bacterium]